MELELKKLELEETELSEYIQKIAKCFNNQQANFAELCYAVYKIDCWFTDNLDCVCKSKYDATYFNRKQLFKQLGFSNKQVNRYINCYQKFMTLDDVGSKIKESFVSFSPSKLFELLPVSNSKLEEFISNGQISSSMTVKEIREFLKTIEEKENFEELEEGEETSLDENFYVLKNETMRKDFIENFRSWGVWFEEPRLKLKYYRCRIGEKVLVAILGKIEILSSYYINEHKIEDSVKFCYMSPNGELLLDPTCETAILKDMSAVPDKRVYLFE